MKPIAVLGTGPAGLAAAHGVAMAGYPVALFGAAGTDGKPKRSVIGGAQFLHYPIPMVCGAHNYAELTYRVVGRGSTYHRKAYGSNPEIPFVSFDNVHDGQTEQCWNLQSVYEGLWEVLNVDEANVADVSPQWLDDHADDFDKVISTIPAPALCRTAHRFVTHVSKIANECILDGLPDMTIMYDGTDDRSWHRCSNLWGVGGTEYGSESPVTPGMETVEVPKPITTNCDCNADVLRVGRMGTWQKGVLVHEAFTKAYEALR